MATFTTELDTPESAPEGEGAVRSSAVLAELTRLWNEGCTIKATNAGSARINERGQIEGLTITGTAATESSDNLLIEPGGRWQVNRCGCTRVVILTRRYAIKLPNILNGWKLFLCGLLANMQERQFARAGWPELCPIAFSTPGGWLVVMRRAREMTDSEFQTFDSKAWADRGTHLIPCEHKSNSFGWIDDRVVCIDYGS